jgi:hypothetical protein
MLSEQTCFAIKWLCKFDHKEVLNEIDIEINKDLNRVLNIIYPHKRNDAKRCVARVQTYL